MNFSMRSSPRDKKEKVGGEKAVPAARHLNEAWLREPNASCKQTLPFFSPPRKIGVVLERALFTPAVPKSQGGLCASWRKARLLETALAQQSEKRSADRRSGHEDGGAGGSASVPLLRARGYGKVFRPYFSQYFKQPPRQRSSFFIFNVV